ncbi:MAG: RHS repeat protein, partial [Planctomycetota bacterium]|nr:RHS repeat protein [Planctomycetota bacterium]
MRVDTPRIRALWWELRGTANAAGNPAAAIVSGFDARGRLLAATDSAGRTYAYQYSTVGGEYERLTGVRVQHSFHGAAAIARVEYAYGTSADAASMVAPGDLKAVTVVTPTSMSPTIAEPSQPQSVNVTRTTQYRTWTKQSPALIDGLSRGPEHSIRLVIGPEGVRRAGAALCASGTDAQLAPFASSRFGYDAKGRVNRIESEGLTQRHVQLEYATPAVPVGTGNGYDRAWAMRTTASVFVPPSQLPAESANPAGLLRAQVSYFDETGQRLSSVVIGAPLASAPGQPRHWASTVQRDVRGRVVRIGTPASIAAFDVQNGTFTAKDGPVLIFERISVQQSYELQGFIFRERHATTRGGQGDLDSRVQYATLVPTGVPQTPDASPRRDLLGAYSIYRPLIISTTHYPHASSIDQQGVTTQYTYHQPQASTPGNELALSLEWVQVTYPAISLSQHGSGEPTFGAVAMRPNGVVTYVRSRGDAHAPLLARSYLLPGNGGNTQVPTGKLAAVHEDVGGQLA